MTWRESTIPARSYAEEALQREVEELRDRVRDKEREWRARLDKEAAGRDEAEAELRTLQASSRAERSTVEAANMEAAAQTRAREAQLASEVEALRAEAAEKEKEWR